MVVVLVLYAIVWSTSLASADDRAPLDGDGTVAQQGPPDAGTRARTGGPVRTIADPADRRSGDEVIDSGGLELRVQVRDARTLAPIAGATVVSLTSTQAMALSNAGRRAEMEALGSVLERVLAYGARDVTGARGVVSVPVSAPNVVHLFSEHEGRSAHRVVEIPPDGEPSSVVLDLRPGNALCVRVRDRNHRPLARIPVGLVIATGSAGHPRWHNEPWGETDANGCVLRRGARHEFEMLTARLGVAAAEARAHVAPLVAGASRSEAVPVDFARDEVEIVVTTPVGVELLLTGPGGRRLHWPSPILHLSDPDGMVQTTAVTRAGRASILGLPGRPLRWRAMALFREVGNGEAAITGSSAIELPMEGVLIAMGRITRSDDAKALEVDVESPWRKEVTSVVELDAMGRFEFPVLERECRSVVLRHCGMSRTVVMPEATDGVLNLGLIRFFAPGARPARVLLRDAEGAAPADPVLSVESPAGAEPPAMARTLGDATYELTFTGSESEAAVVVGAGSSALERYTVRAGEEKVITLPASGGLVVRTPGTREAAARLLAISLAAIDDARLVRPTVWGRQRASEESGESAGGPHSAFEFDRLRPGSYALSVWSSIPPCKLHSSLIRIADGENEILLEPTWREVKLEFDRVVDGDVLVGLPVPTGRREWSLARSDQPRQTIVMPRDCRSIAYVGEGILPGVLDVTSPIVRLVPVATRGPAGRPGCRVSPARGEADRRLIVVTFVDGSRRRSSQTWGEFARARPLAWLPCDYAVVDEDGESVVRFDGRGWRPK